MQGLRVRRAESLDGVALAFCQETGCCQNSWGMRRRL
jgi:hypothetical protein